MEVERGDAVLALNAGSSSLKFGYYAIHGTLTPLLRGEVIRSSEHVQVEASGLTGQRDVRLSSAPLEDQALMDRLLHWLAEAFKHSQVVAVGHRIVHGGRRFTAPALLDSQTTDAIDRLTPLAPLHQPLAVSLIRAVSRLRPDLPQVGCFDTVFHHALAPPVSRYGVPRALERDGIRRYGFHGLSYEHIAGELGGYRDRRIVVAHLGNGASLCAMRNGSSCDTTMGFSALDGLVMSTRPGQLDPGVLLYLLQHQKRTPGEIEDLLYRESGLKGVSGLSGDIRDLLASDAPEAAEAIDLFVFRIGREAAAMASTLGGIDTFVFTGGIGEHCAAVRTRVAHALGWLGGSIDEAANARNAQCISVPSSRIELLIIPTDEERVIAAHTRSLLNLRK